MEIRYRLGRAHGNTDALSRSSMENVAAELAGGVNQVAVGCSEMAEQQKQDPKLKVLVDYMEQGVLPSDERLAKKTVVESSQFSLMDGILYFVDGGRGSNLWIVVPEAFKKKLIEETHAGSLTGHFAARSLYTTPYLGCIGGKECTVMCTNSATVA